MIAKLTNLFRAFVRHLRAHGVQKTLATAFEHAGDKRRAWVNAGFDRKYGTDTSGVILDQNELGVHTENREFSCGYEGIQMPVFRRIYADLDVNPAKFAFIDFGSGKGRAVMLAAERKFTVVHGVEFSPVLHKIAEANVDRFKKQNPGASPIVLRCQDAATFEIPPGDLVCFFYNPFDQTVMAKVLANIEKACAESPRRVVVAYRNPLYADVFDKFPFLRETRSTSTYRIYASQPAVVA
ncbi:MAG: class I SAM-dependent methyltransferase [Betaproteobacteria bacterium]